jgi:hypothetical protein
VSFTVRPKDGSPTGTRIDAQARIVFDANAPIDTPPWVNTLDLDPPSSRVNSLLPTTNSASFFVSWAGTDGTGSGIASFDVFVSDNGGAFVPFLEDTAATSTIFNGQVGHTYAFYTTARDNVGHVEVAPTIADATTTTALEPGDYNRDGIVEADDEILWRSTFGQTGAGLAADGNHDGTVNAADWVIWRKYRWHIVHDSLGDYNLDNVFDRGDYDLWRGSFGHVGENLAADGNRDGMIDAVDYVIWKNRDRSLVLPPPASGPSLASVAADSAVTVPTAIWDAAFERAGGPALSTALDEHESLALDRGEAAIQPLFVDSILPARSSNQRDYRIARRDSFDTADARHSKRLDLLTDLVAEVVRLQPKFGSRDEDSDMRPAQIGPASAAREGDLDQLDEAFNQLADPVIG